jgi:hypothetical protein
MLRGLATFSHIIRVLMLAGVTRGLASYDIGVWYSFKGVARILLTYLLATCGMLVRTMLYV